MEAKEKAKELFDKFYKLDTLIEYDYSYIDKETAKACAIIAIENEYYEKRELIFLLRTNQAINEKVYLHFIQHLFDEEKQIKQIIEEL